jgi:hypothetical protein
MSLLDDFVEIEKLEMASGDHQASGPSKADSGSAASEKNDKFPIQNGSVSNGHPEWVQDILEVVKRKQEASGESIGAILEEIRRALDQSHAKGDASDALYDRIRLEKMVSNLLEKITAVICVSAEDDVARSRSLLHENPEFVSRLEYLVHVCHDVLHEKAKLENFVDQVCLVLEYIVSQYFSNQVRQEETKNFDGDESSSTVITNGEHDMQSATSTAALDIQTEAHQEPTQSAGQLPEKLEERQLNEELAIVILHNDMEPVRKSSYYKIER